MIFVLHTEHSPELILKSFTDDDFRRFTFGKENNILVKETIVGTDIQKRMFFVRKENSVPETIKKITGVSDVEFEINETINLNDYREVSQFEVHNKNLNLFNIKGKRFIYKSDDGKTVVKYELTVNTRFGRICKYFIERSYKKSQIDYLNMMSEFYTKNDP